MLRKREKPPRKGPNWTAVLAAGVGLSLLFYAALFGLVQVYPNVTGHSIKIEWPALVAALVPVALIVVLWLLSRSSTVRAKFGQFEVEFSSATADILRAEIALDRGVYDKGGLYDLPERVEQVRNSGARPTILRVTVPDDSRASRIEFLALRDYVFGLADVAPLKYIVFVGDQGQYHGFVTAELFEAKYPKLAYERLLDDIAVRRERDEVPIVGDVFGNVMQLREQLRRELMRRYGMSNVPYISRGNLEILGAMDISLVEPVMLTTYTKIVAARVPGIPVVDRQKHFMGIADKSYIEEQVVSRLLGHGSSEG